MIVDFSTSCSLLYHFESVSIDLQMLYLLVDYCIIKYLPMSTLFTNQKSDFLNILRVKTTLFQLNLHALSFFFLSFSTFITLCLISIFYKQHPFLIKVLKTVNIRPFANYKNGNFMILEFCFLFSQMLSVNWIFQSICSD